MKRKHTRIPKPTRKQSTPKPAPGTIYDGIEMLCRCGCKEPVAKGSRFRQGHDARMRPNSKWRQSHPELEVAHG